MKNVLRVALLTLLVAALPLRAAASVTAVFCLPAGHGAPAQAHGHAPGTGDGGNAQHEEDSSRSPLGHDCGFCAKHCSGSAFALATEAPRLAVGAPADPIPFGTLPAFGFFPEHPERPPLAL